MARSAAPGHFSGGSSARNAWSPAGGGVHSSGGGVHSSGLGGHGAAGGFSSGIRHDALNHYGDVHRDFNRYSFFPRYNVHRRHWTNFHPRYAFYGFGLGFYGSYWPGYYSYAYPATYSYPVAYADSAAYPPTYYYEEPATTNSYPVSTNDFSATLKPEDQGRSVGGEGAVSGQRPDGAAPEDVVIPRTLIPSRETPEALPEENSAQPDTNKPPATP